ncbi:M20 family metallopeptidase [Alicyclobacillus mengziensis]|uniref:Probable succinyl-diaminopimelate desuccinylase n=1 Tax=Alicyclobacillus mengziensis TaxID=2931921 RepID=A0A9X7Z995_9BACL|nr:M20 family metallopeptidase [Alicyclobacillus mengziensis]QSO49370.1 M20 family metallopeptidase [Alicyclobacillus mengziensis]
MADAKEVLKQIVQIPSINPPGDELPVAIVLKQLLDNYGIENRLIDLGDNRANLVAWLRAAEPFSNGPVLTLSGHMDVVPAGQVEWEFPPFDAREEDGKIYGRGTSDMKGGLVGLVFAMIELKEQGVRLQGDVKLLASAGEEAGAFGARKFVDMGYMDDVDALIIAEPSNENVFVAHKGALWVEITTYGKTAHGSTPELGVNAIEHMNRIVTGLFQNFNMEFSVDPLLGSPTWNIAVIEGGVKTNVVPDKCRIEIDIRTVPSQRHEDILDSLQEVLDAVQEESPQMKAEMRVINDLPPIYTDPSHPFVCMVRDATANVYGEQKPIKGMSGYTDGAVLSPVERGVPAVIIGGGRGELAHQPNEFINTDKFLRAIELYKDIIIRFVGVEATI